MKNHGVGLRPAPPLAEARVTQLATASFRDMSSGTIWHIYSEILSDILSGIYFHILFEFYLASILAFYLAFFLAGILTSFLAYVQVRVSSLIWSSIGPIVPIGFGSVVQCRRAMSGARLLYCRCDIKVRARSDKVEEAELHLC